jgi:glycosyltransferase involved in cell wall biosynthesis
MPRAGVDGGAVPIYEGQGSTERRVRVGFDARWYNDSGVGSYVAGLLPALVRARCELVAYIDADNPLPGLDRLDVGVVPISSGRYSPLASREFQRRVEQDKLTLFHSPFYPALKLDCPVIVTIHDLIPFLFPIYMWPKQQMVKAGYRRAAREAAHIIADSYHTDGDIQKILGVSGERITTVHLAAARQHFHSFVAAGEFEHLQRSLGIRAPYVVVASARNWRTKNLEGALTVLSAARAAGAEFQTVVYGPLEGLAGVRNTALWQSLDPRHTGYVEAAELGALFRHAHGFVMPSLYEGFGLPLVEAMSCGCPVLASNCGSLPEVAGAGARCFEPFDVQSMTSALLALLRSPQELERRKADALKRSLDFSWDKAALETIRVYHHVNRQVCASQAR